MGIFSNLETINIPPLFPWEEEESSEDSFRWLISFLDSKGTISGWTSINSLQLRFQNSNKINNDTSCYILWKKKFGIWSNFVRKIGQFFRLIKRFPPVPSSRNIGGRFLPPPGRCSRDRCGEKCARARHRARTLVTRTSGLVWERAASTNCGNG